MRDQMRKLLEFPKYIPELKMAAEDLIHLVDPPPEIHLTMGALFLLLEEPDKYIEVCNIFPRIILSFPTFNSVKRTIVQNTDRLIKIIKLV